MCSAETQQYKNLIPTSFNKQINLSRKKDEHQDKNLITSLKMTISTHQSKIINQNGKIPR